MPLSVPILDATTLVSYVLILTRIGGLFLSAPILSQRRIPGRLKIMISMILALLLMPVVSRPTDVDPGLITLVAWLIGELAVGALIGLIASFFFAGLATGGQMVGFQMGLTYAGAVDPQFNTRMSPVSEVLNLAGLLLFLIMNGHHHLLRALTMSYRLIPVGGFEMSALRMERLITASGGIFLVALQIAAPIIVLLLLTDAAFALMSRMVPQMNIFLVGAPLKIGVGMIMLTLTMPLFGALLTAFFSTLDQHLLTILGGI